MRSLMLVIAAAACAAPQILAESPSEEASYTAGRVAGEPRNCIPITSSSEGLRSVDRRTLAYRSGRTIWLNRLPDDCPGLRPLATLIVESYGNRYCRGDRVRALDSGTNLAGPVCALGDFTPYRRPE